MIKRLHHIGVAVKNLDEALAAYDGLLGLKPSRIETMPDQGVKAALIAIGDTEIELMEAVDANSAVAKFLDRRGEGLHHICLEVDDVDQELRSLAAKGVELVDQQGRPGLAGKVGFLHPRAAKGVLIELVQRV